MKFLRIERKESIEGQLRNENINRNAQLGQGNKEEVVQRVGARSQQGGPIGPHHPAFAV